MNTKTVETPFSPFVPASQPAPMFDGQVMPPAEPVKRRRGRPAKVVADSAEPVKRRKPGRDKQAPGKLAKSPKFDLQTILKIANSLKETDQKMFEKMIGELAQLPKATRSRILSAVQEVFG